MIGSARVDRVSVVHQSSPGSRAGADDVRLQLERALNDAADRLSRIDPISAARADVFLERQSGCDALDEAEASMTRDAVFAARERLLARIRRLRDALARLETGGYGRCVECGAAIPTARLCALPEATMCVTCQERHELTAGALPLETRHERRGRGVATRLLARRGGAARSG
jgi:RNA polymerase-binding transcription factor DksA